MFLEAVASLKLTKTTNAFLEILCFERLFMNFEKVLAYRVSPGGFIV